MKKIILSFLLILSFQMMFAQLSDWDNLKVRIQKSDAEIANEAKKAKLKTWDSRAQLFLQVYGVNTANIYVGMHQSGIKNVNGNLLTGADVIVGTPKSTKKNPDGTLTWIYDRIELTFGKDSLLEKWKETQALDDKALEKAFEAIKEAEKLDPKKTYTAKSTTKQTTAQIRDAFMYKGIAKYDDGNYADALSCFDNSLLLYDYPREKTDTLFSPGMINFFAGEFASKLNKFDASKKYYAKAIELNYEPITCYRYLFTIATQENNKEEQRKIVDKAYKANSSSLDVIDMLITYYRSVGDTEGALEYIKKAVDENPTNATVYFVQGILYDALANDSLSTDEAKKQKYFEESIKSYNKSIEINKDYFDANYNAGVMYYMKAKKTIEFAQSLPSSEKTKYDKEIEESKKLFAEALPYMEEAHRIDATDQTVMSTLITIYLRLQKYDKQKEMKAKLEAAKNK